MPLGFSKSMLTITLVLPTASPSFSCGGIKLRESFPLTIILSGSASSCAHRAKGTNSVPRGANFVSTRTNLYMPITVLYPHPHTSVREAIQGAREERISIDNLQNLPTSPTSCWKRCLLRSFNGLKKSAPKGGD